MRQLRYAWLSREVVLSKNSLSGGLIFFLEFRQKSFTPLVKPLYGLLLLRAEFQFLHIYFSPSDSTWDVMGKIPLWVISAPGASTGNIGSQALLRIMEDLEGSVTCLTPRALK